MVVSAWPAIRDGNPGPAGLRPLGTEPRRPSGDRLENRGRPQRAAVTERVATYALLTSGDAPHLPPSTSPCAGSAPAPARATASSSPPPSQSSAPHCWRGWPRFAPSWPWWSKASPSPTRFPSAPPASVPRAPSPPSARPPRSTRPRPWLRSWTAPPHPLTPDAPSAAAIAVGEALLATEAAATLAKAQVRSCRGR